MLNEFVELVSLESIARVAWNRVCLLLLDLRAETRTLCGAAKRGRFADWLLCLSCDDFIFGSF